MKDTDNFIEWSLFPQGRANCKDVAKHHDDDGDVTKVMMTVRGDVM